MNNSSRCRCCGGRGCPCCKTPINPYVIHGDLEVRRGLRDLARAQHEIEHGLWEMEFGLGIKHPPRGYDGRGCFHDFCHGAGCQGGFAGRQQRF